LLLIQLTGCFLVVNPLGPRAYKRHETFSFVMSFQAVASYPGVWEVGGETPGTHCLRMR